MVIINDFSITLNAIEKEINKLKNKMKESGRMKRKSVKRKTKYRKLYASVTQ